MDLGPQFRKHRNTEFHVLQVTQVLKPDSQVKEMTFHMFTNHLTTKHSG